MTWFLDFVGFQFPATGFIVKEIAILNSAGSRCYNYFITGPKSLIVDDHNTYNYQYGMHNLQFSWSGVTTSLMKQCKTLSESWDVILFMLRAGKSIISLTDYYQV